MKKTVNEAYPKEVFPQKIMEEKVKDILKHMLKD